MTMTSQLEHQLLKVQLLETQATVFRQQLELSELQLQKLEPMLRAERMALMALQREEINRENAQGLVVQGAVAAPDPPGSPGRPLAAVT